MKLLKSGRASFTKSSVALLLTGGLLVTSTGCAAQDVLNFYSACTAGTQFQNYKYTMVLESEQFKTIASNSSVAKGIALVPDGFAFTGIVADDDAFSTALQLRLDGQYKDLLQIVVRDKKIYIDLGSILETLKAIAPEMYNTSIQPTLTQAAQAIATDEDKINAQLEPYGVTAEQLKSRLNGNLGWVSISMSSIDDTLSQLKSSNPFVKSAIPLESISDVDSKGYPEALRKFANNLGKAIEKRFSDIKPAITDVDKTAKSTYTLHLNSDNFGAFVDGVVDFLNEDIITLIDSTVEDMTKANLTDAVDAFKKLKTTLTEEHESYDYETDTTVKKSILQSCIVSLKSAKDNVIEQKEKGSTFDWLSKVSLTGDKGSREWKLSNTLAVDCATPIGNTDITHGDLTYTVTMQEFKDATAAISAMVDPSAEALSLDTALSSALSSASSFGGIAPQSIHYIEDNVAFEE